MVDQFLINPKTAGGDQFDPPCGFSKTVSSKERVKHCFFVTFNIIIRHVFPENFIEIPQVVQKIWRISLSAKSFFNKVAALRSAPLLKKRLWHRRFHAIFAKFLRTTTLKNICERLLLPFLDPLIVLENFGIFCFHRVTKRYNGGKWVKSVDLMLKTFLIRGSLHDFSVNYMKFLKTATL